MTVFQRIGDMTREVTTGDILVNRLGKTYVFTGADSRGNLQLTSTCDRKYFVTASPRDYNCYVSPAPTSAEQPRAKRESSKEAA
jgi:hypothetical protein